MNILAGTDYTIADIAVFPWYGGLVKGWSYDAAEFLQVQDYKHVQRWADAILERPAVPAWAHGQSRPWRAREAVARTSRRQRFRDEDSGQADGRELGTPDAPRQVRVSRDCFHLNTKRQRIRK